MSQTEVQLIKNGAVVDADINGMSSSKLSGALPAISGASLTNLPAGAGKAKNLIINGAMQVAQRGTSSTTNGYGSVDRFEVQWSGTDETPTHAQADVSSGTTPYTLGFRKSLKVTNGNQTSGAGAGDYLRINHIFEAQNIANSGWNYVSSSSNITLSFWVKSSVAQNFYGYFYTYDGSNYSYPFETGSLSANTWTKITKTIPGNSNITIDNDNNQGLAFVIVPFFGTNYTANGVTLDAWKAWNSSERFPDNTTTWFTTNDATFEITGVQLEVGDSATDFEHRSFAQELQLCKRYYEVFNPTLYVLARYTNSSGGAYNFHTFEVEKRTNPTASFSGTFTNSTGYAGDPNFSNADSRGIAINSTNSVASGGILYLDDSGSAFCKFDAEL